MLERVAIAPEAEGAAENRAIVARARQRGFRRFVVPAGADVPAPGGEIVVREGEGLRLAPGAPLVPIRPIDGPAELDRALAEAPAGGLLVLRWLGDRVIPLEAAVAGRGRRFELWTFARRPSDAPAALGALEHGADRVIVPVRSPQEVDELERVLGSPVLPGLAWTTVPVTEVHPAGVGDRVIVDTTSLLAPEEGLLVGSAAGFLFHVASEAVGSTFSRPRPFRVNAGAPHSYVLMADGGTRYLSELNANDAVLAVRPGGPARPVRVGRLKLERRPLVVVRADDDGVARTVFLQEAETVRLSGEHGRIPTTELGIGARVQGVRLPPARHLGAAVEETIEER
jgi:3-dehydroquinate synthase II